MNILSTAVRLAVVTNGLLRYVSGAGLNAVACFHSDDRTAPRETAVMATILARASRSLCVITRRLPVVARSSAGARGLHVTSIVLARKSAEEYDPFVAEDDELFPTSSESPQGSSPASTASTSAEQSKKLSDSARLERFEELFDFVKTHVGRRVVRPDARQVRNSAWTHLFELATTEEQLRRVSGLFTTWTESRRQWTDNHVEVFVRRCVELDCAKLALDVFSDHSKYGFGNLTAHAAQILLKGLHAKHSLADVTTLLALYSLYNLPPLTADPVSCSMLTAASVRATLAPDVPPKEQAAARALRSALLPQLRQTLEAAGPLQADKRESVWAKYALAKVQKGLEKEGEDVSWLQQWRAASGHLEPSLRDQKLAAKRELQATA